MTPARTDAERALACAIAGYADADDSTQDGYAENHDTIEEHGRIIELVRAYVASTRRLHLSQADTGATWLHVRPANGPAVDIALGTRDENRLCQPALDAVLKEQG